MYIKGPYKKIGKSYFWLVMLIIIIPPMVFFLKEKPHRSEAEDYVNQPSRKPIKQHIVIIDPGHGGTDPGACRAGVMEKDINLAIARKTTNFVANHEVKVHLTRDRDIDFVKHGVYSKEAEREDLAKRIAIAHRFRGEIFVSIHVNAGLGRDKGAEIYYDPNNQGSITLARVIQEELNKIPGMPQKKTKAEQFYLFDNLTIPVVIVETGWLCNPVEREKLLNPDYQEQLAKAIGQGITTFFKIHKPK